MITHTPTETSWSKQSVQSSQAGLTLQLTLQPRQIAFIHKRDLGHTKTEQTSIQQTTSQAGT